MHQSWLTVGAPDASESVKWENSHQEAKKNEKKKKTSGIPEHKASQRFDAVDNPLNATRASV